ncbi:acyl-coenzyme A thioesterase 13-like isoform X1 [Varroa jacobsoni]|uniref:acyl-coenzyme A thioesterase 13-like isoform X1 n=1 Tax=Varroa jacobsoni TaxID=62625 RepID=UPI000BF53AD4|nr:acyl-coenzyme A thioesterase 13-like isoform X1 [Varroa jacobsoni]
MYTENEVKDKFKKNGAIVNVHGKRSVIFVGCMRKSLTLNRKNSLDSIFGTGGSSNRRPQQNALPLNMRIEVSENNRYMFRPTRSVIDVEYLPLLLMRMKGGLRQLLQAQIREKNFNAVLTNLELKSASDGRCVAELLVTRPHLNVARTLHGGLSATLVDSVSTFALLTQRNVRSVSVDLSVSFIGPAKEGDLITIDATTLKVGQTLAYLTVDIRKQSKLIITGKHTKFLQQNVDYYGNKF